jgi:hypothetical protein
MCCPSFEPSRRRDIGSFAGIAEALNVRGIRTARGGAWHASTVRNLLSRRSV